MIVDFRLPYLGDGIHSADVIKVLVKEGDNINTDQVVVEIETDKATVEVPSDVSGIVKKVYVKDGQKADVGEPLVAIEVSSSQFAVSSLQSAVGSLQLAVDSEKQEVGKEKESEIKNQISEIRNKKSVEENSKSKNPITDNQQPITSIFEFKIPPLGENITTADITKVLVKAGDKVEANQIVLEIETDKATVEIPTEVGGIVKEVKVKDGDKAAVGQVAFVIENEKPQPTTNHQSPITDNRQPITNNQQPASPSKIDLTHHLPTVISVPKDISKVVVPAAPSVRRFAREIGVDISLVQGSGSSGRISIDDVKTYAKAISEQFRRGGFGEIAVGIIREILPDFSKWGEIDRQPMSNIRKKTAEHLSYSWATIPHVTQFDKANITELENLRKQFGKKVSEAGGKLTVTAILLKVIASAFKVFPQFNTSVDMDKSEIIYKKYVNIGVAVDTDRGLLVPVIRDVDKKNIIQLSIELQEVSRKARDKKLSLEEMQGGCFTISNLGGIGGTYFTPIVNTPEVAILGVSKSSYEPVYINEKPAELAGKFEPRLIMPLSLSYDHRIIDGADGIKFLRWVVNALENPFLLSLEG